MDTTVSVTEEQAVAAAGLAGLLGASLVFLMVLGLAFTVLMIIARWKIFTKAGQEGWKSIIPIYSDYIEWKLSWNNITLFWVALGLSVLGAILFTVGGGSSSTSSSPSFMAILGAIVLLGACVLDLMQTFKLFQSFGKGVGWFVGYLFIPNIMMLVLGFGSAQYLGPQD
jgi:hypothetical protein